MHPEQRVIGRFAPSPTGALHTGSLVAAVGSYLMAKRSGGDWLLRLDDLDTQRQVAGCADDILRTLESFGLFWDGPVSRQSGHLKEYQQAFAELQQKGDIYPCCCSRKDIAGSASAPHHTDDGIPYPGTCRTGVKRGAVVRSWRVRVPDREICFSDMRKGQVCQNLSSESGDFALRRSDGDFTYQLAVVVDDYCTGVNQVVRGDDLLLSTPRQIFLQQLLGFPTPEYCHLPLVTGPGGTKLSKRDNLISCGADDGREAGPLLVAILRFLGMAPPAELAGYGGTDILLWGLAHFQPSGLPEQGGRLLYPPLTASAEPPMPVRSDGA